MRKPKSDYSIQTVSNALHLLEAFADEHEIGVADLSRRLGLHKNNVFRLLATLEEHGYIEQNARTERYRLGLRNLELGQAFARSREELLARARPTLEALADETRETVHLGMIDEFEVVHVDGVRAPRMIQCALRLGWRLPVHCTALGKAMLACGPDSEWERFDRTVAHGRALEARTPHTVTDRAKFVEELRAVAARGAAFDLGECEEGLGCAAAPVHDAEGRVIAAISISAPLSRSSTEQLHTEVAPRLVEAVCDLSRQLGFPG